MRSGKYELLAGICVLFFVAAQTFQEIAYRFWIPGSHSPADDLATYLLRVDQVRALLVGGAILLLIVPFTVIAIRYFKTAPLTSVLGLVFGSAFVGLEIVHRSLDFFVVGGWARQFQNASAIQRDVILNRLVVWNQIVQGWYFPLMLSFFLASCCFFVATSSDDRRGKWYILAPLAFGLNALRLLARMLSSFAGQHWLDGFNGKLYFPAVCVINSLLVLWFFYLARQPNQSENSQQLR